MAMLEIRHVKKSFGGREVLSDLSFCVEEHRIYGFVGQNGAGKTTTMKLILGLLSPDAGEILVDGCKVARGRGNRDIGYLPDVPEFYGYMTPEEYLCLCGSVLGLKDQLSEARSLLERVGLQSDARRKIHGFSRGMKQRLGIAQALLGNPKLLICDEPTSALDPAGRKELLELLGDVRDDTTVLFSTHILSDVERICDRVGVLHRGKLRMEGTIEEIRRRHGSGKFSVEFRTAEQAKALDAAIPGGCWEGPERLAFSGGEPQLLRAMEQLTSLRLTPLSIEQEEPTLEELYLEVTGQ